MIVEDALKEAIVTMTNPTPEACSHAIALCIAALNFLSFDESRIDRVGQNGNTGEHYLS
jgi:hypothetical protein